MASAAAIRMACPVAYRASTKAVTTRIRKQTASSVMRRTVRYCLVGDACFISETPYCLGGRMDGKVLGISASNTPQTAKNSSSETGGAKSTSASRRKKGMPRPYTAILRRRVLIPWMEKGRLSTIMSCVPKGQQIGAEDGQPRAQQVADGAGAGKRKALHDKPDTRTLPPVCPAIPGDKPKGIDHGNHGKQGAR